MAAAALAAFAIPSANACSFSWKPGWSPEEIKNPERDDIRRVKGVFRVIDVQGRTGEDGYLESGSILGRIKTARGTGWDTRQPYDAFSVECGAYRRPTSDAQGVFWIKRQKANDRYELVLWEGKYLPDRRSGPHPASAALRSAQDRSDGGVE